MTMTFESHKRRGNVCCAVNALLASAAFGCSTAENATHSSVQIGTLVQAPPHGMQHLTDYPDSQPQITLLKIMIAPHATLQWHSDPMPNAGYVLSGELTLEKEDGSRRRFITGQALTETVDCVHRGVTGDAPVILIYAGEPGLPISQPASGIRDRTSSIAK